MYRALWNLLPGPKPVKALLAIAIAVGVFFLLMEVVFPWVSPMMPYNDVAVQSPKLAMASWAICSDLKVCC